MRLHEREGREAKEVLFRVVSSTTIRILPHAPDVSLPTAYTEPFRCSSKPNRRLMRRQMLADARFACVLSHVLSVVEIWSSRKSAGEAEEAADEAV